MGIEVILLPLCGEDSLSGLSYLVSLPCHLLELLEYVLDWLFDDLSNPSIINGAIYDHSSITSHLAYGDIPWNSGEFK